MKKIALLVLLTASPAFAHARLTRSAPAANARVAAPHEIRLVFSETLEPVFSAASLVDAAGRTVPVSRSVAANTITLLPLRLKPGFYKVFWHSVGQDTHRLSGSFGFTVVP